MKLKKVKASKVKVGDRILYKGLTREVKKTLPTKKFITIVLDKCCLAPDEKKIKISPDSLLNILIFTKEEQKIYFN